MLKSDLQSIVFSSLQEMVSFFDENQKRYITLIDSIVADNFDSIFPSPSIKIKLTEGDKVFEQVERLSSLLLDMEADRETTLIIAGGGVLTDLGAFTASIYMRGIPFILVPTTLLAMVDAAIGGKNGVNLGNYKNILGTFRQPQHTIICPQLLKTLPQNEYHNGLAELLKTFIIADRKSYFEFIHKMDSSAIDNIEFIAPYIAKAASIKANIVERDQFDKGERRLLNFGHTFAHAIELSENIPHGLAVAKGIILAARLSERLSILNKDELYAIEDGFKRTGFDTSMSVSIESLTNIIKRDKKRNGDIINFVLVKRVGTGIVYPVHISDLKDILHDLS